MADDSGIDPGNLTQEQLDLKEKLLDMIREGIRLNEEEKQQLKDLLDLGGRRLGSLEQEAAALDGQLAKYAKLKDSENKRIMMAETAKTLAETNLKIAKQQLANATEITPEMEKALEVAQKNLETATKNLDMAKGTTEAIKEGAAAGKELGLAMGSMFAAYGQHPFFNAKSIGLLGKVVRGLADKNMKPLDNLIGGMVGGSLAAIAGSFINLIFLVDETQSAFRRATGAGDEYTDSLASVYEQTRLYGVELKEVSETMQSLYTTYTDFTMISQRQREELTTTGALLQKLGITTEDFAQGVQTQTKMFGLSADAAAANSRELADFAQQIGVAPAQMGKDFAAAGAGKLNAALGGNFVNAMDLMTATDPVERFEMIRDSILNAGLSFDEMSYYQRLFYKDAIGLDSVGDLALMLSGDMSTLAGATQQTTADYKRLQDEAGRVMNVQEKFKALMMSLIDPATEIIDRIQKWTTALQQDEEMQKVWSDRIKMVTDTLITLGEAMVFVADHWGKLLFVWGTFKVAGLLSKLGLLSKWFGVTAPAAAGKGAAAIQAASGAVATGATTVGQAVSQPKVAIGLATFAAVLLAIGFSIKIAAEGLATLVMSFAGLGPNGMAAAVAVAAVAGAFYLLIPALKLLIPTLVVGWPALLAFAGVMLAMGGAIYMAAAGFALLVPELAKMFQSIDMEKLAGLGVFLWTVAPVAALLPIAAGGLTIFAAAMGAFALALKLFPTSDLEPITAFLTSVAAAGGAALSLALVAEAIRDIGNEIELLPEMKDFQTTMQVVTQAAKATTTSAALRSPTAVVAAVAANAGGGAGGAPYNVTVELKVDRDKLGKQVFTLMDGKLREGAYGQS